MGGLFSVSISIENTISFCCNCSTKHASYACRVGKHMGVLETKMEELKALRNDVKRRVQIAERQHMKRLDQVEWWFSRVEVLEKEVEELITKIDHEKECPGCCYPRNCWSSYKLGKTAAKTLKKVRRHRKKGQFETVAETLPPAPGDIRPCEQTVGMDSMFSTVWNCLSEDQAGTIGLYGMGGIGKTTLLTQINNMLLSLPSNVDFVIWAVASKDLKPEKIQEEIGEKIGYSDDMWRNKSIEQKAIDIYRVLSTRKFVLLLDDLWDRIDLTKIGVPIPDQQNNSKVVFTTRSKMVCGMMEAHKRFKVECLPPPFDWHLFQKKVGNDTLNLHPDIPKLAEIVTKQCAGLPLALITIGRAMACKKTPQEWIHAIEVLRKCASEFSGMGDKVFPLLKFSFDHLPNEKVRSCFLYCTLFPEDFVIHKIDLIDYWICEGLLDEFNDRNGAQNQGYDIIGTLVYACLLEEEEGQYVKMHDVIRDMALWIANMCNNFEEGVLVQAGVRLIEAPEIRKWEAVRRISLMANRLESLIETPSCPNLLTLFLNENTLKKITNDFFPSMPNLRVLDLSCNNGLNELPHGISKLVSLQYLNLSKTSIRQLPNELKSLQRLKYLNLEDTFALNTIPCQLISSFPFLQVLRMFHCGSSDLVVQGNILSGGNDCLVKELQCLKQLCVLSLTVKSASALEGFLSSHKFKSCTQDLCLQFLSGSNILNISCLADMKQLNMLDISDCKSLEELKHDCLQEPRKKLTTVDFHNSMILKDRWFNGLQRVSVDNCMQLGDLTWLMLVPNLASLFISRCSQIKEIISTAKCAGLQERVGRIKPFEKLEVLHLSYLPELKCIYQDPLPFLSLNKISIFGCPKLKKLPVNAKSAEGSGITIHGWEFWWKELEWEDETTKNAFVPCFKSRPLNISQQ